MLELDHLLGLVAEELGGRAGGEAHVVLREVEAPVEDDGPVQAAGPVVDEILACGDLELDDVVDVVEFGLRFEGLIFFLLIK